MGVSAMMQQYLRIKELNKDALLFFRLGDFYELFYDDAILVSELLELTLTGKNCGSENRAPMCGVPHHAADSYIAKLLEKGYKVAICEQCDENETAKLIKRDVVRVITPGTIVESNMLSEDKNNYLVSVYYGDDEIGISWSDISTGELNHALIIDAFKVKLNDLLMRIDPAEIICNEKMMRESVELSAVQYNGICRFSIYNEQAFDYDNALACLTSQLNAESMIDIKNKPACICSAGALISYVVETQKRAIPHIKNSNDQDRNQYMILDATARKTLELVETMTDSKKKSGSLLGLMDKTSTCMGSRLLRKWIERPSNDINIINDRLNGVEELLVNIITRDKLQVCLSQIFDIERLASKLSLGTISPRECLSLEASLIEVPKIQTCLSTLKSNIFGSLKSQIIAQNDIVQLINEAISENAPLLSRDSGIIRDGYDEELDKLRHAKENAVKIINEIEAAERQSTGIKNLKIGYNRVFGYYIEVSKSQVDSVPYRYIRKQTISNGERYITEELKEIESMVLNSAEKAIMREQELFIKVCDHIKEALDDILITAKNLAILDCLISNSIIAKQNNYSKPTILSDGGVCKIAEGRHPIVEKLNKRELFVPNDTMLNDGDSKIMLITGPNMAGKSIYMKQVALITIMAHMGSYVPAKSAQISLVDRIFTRVGASDDLSTGRSTFMVEMSEVSTIISNATDRSLILLDEVGRGTSTYDGLSIAWSIIDYLSNNLKAKVLFSTHYFELTELEGVLEGVKNYKLMVKEFQGSVIFLRKLMRGSANRSFGIEVAGLAGIPEQTVSKAKELLAKLEAADIGRQAKMAGNHQLSIFNASVNNEVSAILKDLDTDNLTPRQAMDVLIDLKDKVVKCQ